jgi:hypothetical protein
VGALYEQHITGDVAMAFRLQYYLTQDDIWLKTHAWPVIQGAAEFWAGRFELDPTSSNYTIKVGEANRTWLQAWLAARIVPQIIRLAARLT